MDAILFYVFAALALLGGVVVVAQRHAVVSAFALVGTLCSLAAIYGLLGSPFIAALQVIVYAGAIMVLFLFVIMLLNVKAEDRPPAGRRGMQAAAVVLGVLLAGQVALAVLHWRVGAPGAAVPTEAMARELFLGSSQPFRYLYAFEATSVLIVAALVGAVVLAKKDLR